MQNILKLCGILILVFAEVSCEMKSETPIRNSSAEIMTKPHSDLLLKLQKFLETHKDTENHLNEIRSKPTPLEHVESTTEITTFNRKLKQMNKENIAPKAQIEKQYKVKEVIDKVNYTENKTNTIPKQLNTNNIASIIKNDTAMPIETDNTHVFTMYFGKIPPSSTTPGTIRRSTNQKIYLRTQNEKNITTNENIMHDTGNTSLAINIETDDSESSDSDSDSDSDEEQVETTTVATQQPQDDKHVEVKKNTYVITKTTTRLIFVNPIKEVMNKYLRVFKRRQQLIKRRKGLSEEELLYYHKKL